MRFFLYFQRPCVLTTFLLDLFIFFQVFFLIIFRTIYTTVQFLICSVTSVLFIPNTHMFFSAGRDGKIKQWDADKHERITTFSGHHSEVWSLALTTDGRTLVSTSHDRTIRLWQKTDEILVLEEERETVNNYGAIILFFPRNFSLCPRKFSLCPRKFSLCPRNFSLLRLLIGAWAGIRKASQSNGRTSCTYCRDTF